VKIWYQQSLRTSVWQESCVPTTRHVKEIIVGNRRQFTGSVTSHTRTIVYPLRNHSGKPSQYRDRSMEPHFSFATFLLLKATQRALDLNGTLRVYKSEEKGKWKATERRVPSTLETHRDIRLSLQRKQNVLSFYFFSKIFVRFELDCKVFCIDCSAIGMWPYRSSFSLLLNLVTTPLTFNTLNPELNPICYLLALLAHHFLHVSRIRVKSLTIRLLMSYIYGAPILDVSRSHTTTHHSR